MQHQQVGVKFVEQYFHVLTTKPEDLSAFYAAESSYSCGYHAADRKRDEAVTGLEGIKTKILSQNLVDSYVDISTLDIHSSAADSILVMVIGTLKKESAISRFVHTFLLAKQKTHVFYVASGIFRYLDEEPAIEALAREEKGGAEEEEEAVAFEANGTQERVEEQVEEDEAPKVEQKKEKVAEEQQSFSYAAVAATAKPPVEQQEASKKKQESRKQEPRKQEPKKQEPKKQEKKQERRKVDPTKALYVRYPSNQPNSKKLVASALSGFEKFGVTQVVEKPNHCLVVYETVANAKAALAQASSFTDDSGNTLFVEQSTGGGGGGGRKNRQSNSAGGNSGSNAGDGSGGGNGNRRGKRKRGK